MDIDEHISANRSLHPLALALSALVQILLLVFLTDEVKLDSLLAPPASPPAIPVEIVPPPRPPEARPPEPPQTQEPHKPVLPAPPPPQLEKAPLAKSSQAPKGGGKNDRSSAPPAEIPGRTRFTISGPEQRKAGKAELDGASEQPLTQSEQDFILSQIAALWRFDPNDPEAAGLVLTARIAILPDGTLASPINKDDPWDPSAVIPNYRQLLQPGFGYRRHVLESFLLALRLAQPLKLPPGEHWPRYMTLRFKPGDLK